MEHIQSFFTSNVESLERDLTKLSIDWTDDINNLDNDKYLIDLKEVYRCRLLLTLDNLIGDMLYYYEMYLDEWFKTSVETIYKLHLRRDTIKENMMKP